MTTTRHGTGADREHIGRLLHEVFRDDPVSRWIFPGEEEREAYHPLLFRTFLDVSLAHGTVDMTEDDAAAALWFSVRDGELAGGNALDALPDLLGPGSERLGAMAELTEKCHPVGQDHAYLQAIAVTPPRQRQGLGSAVLRPMLERCDAAGLPAYLEASNEGSRRMYLRFGFADLGEPIRLPAGPPMWPMWREPRPS